MNLFYRFILARESNAERGDYADRIFVDALQDFFWAHNEAVALQRDFTQFNIKITGKFMPANLYWAAD